MVNEWGGDIEDVMILDSSQSTLNFVKNGHENFVFEFVFKSQYESIQFKIDTRADVFIIEFKQLLILGKTEKNIVKVKKGWQVLAHQKYIVLDL